MASGVSSPSKNNNNHHLWDPYAVLNVHPDDPDCTCVGTAFSTQSRCKWPFYTEQFDPDRRTTAAGFLESMARVHPAEITRDALISLARCTLCRDWHQRQAGAVGAEWKAKIDRFLREGSGASGGSVTQLRYGSDGGKQLLRNGFGWDKGASEQGVEEMRQRLEEVTGELRASQSRCCGLEGRSAEAELLKRQLEERNARFEKDKAASWKEIGVLSESKARLERELVGLKTEVDQKARTSKGEADGLRRQLQDSKDESSQEIQRLRQELEARDKTLDERARTDGEEANGLRQQLQDSNDRSSRNIQRLRQELKDLSLNYTESKDENTKLNSRLQEQDRHAEHLIKQTNEANQDLAKRDQHIDQLVEQKEEMQQELAEREVGGPRNVKSGGSS